MQDETEYYSDGNLELGEDDDTGILDSKRYTHLNPKLKLDIRGVNVNGPEDYAKFAEWACGSDTAKRKLVFRMFYIFLGLLLQLRDAETMLKLGDILKILYWVPFI